MFVFQPPDGGCLLEQLLTFDWVFRILVMEMQSILGIEVGVEGNVMVASKPQ
jgi:hypothetical protein